MVNPNLFASGLDRYHRGVKASFDEAQGFRDQITRKKSGGLLASGDQSGAAAALAEGGLIDDSRQITKDMQGQEQQQYQRGRDAEADKIALAARQLSSLKQISDGLLEAIPEDPSDPGKSAAERFAAFQKMTPVLQQLQIGGDLITQITPDMMTNQGLMAFGAQADQQLKLFNTSGGVVAVDQGALRKDINDPNASRVVYQDPYYAERQQATIEATRARAGASSASAEASRARAAKTRSGGGGSRSGGSSASPDALATLQALKTELARRRGGQ